MSKPTAQERLAKTRERVREAIADAQQTLRAAEAAAREEARKAHRQHLWTLARLLDETGLSVYTAEELAPHFTALAGELGAAGTSDDAGGVQCFSPQEGLTL